MLLQAAAASCAHSPEFLKARKASAVSGSKLCPCHWCLRVSQAGLGAGAATLAGLPGGIQGSAVAVACRKEKRALH